MAPVRAIQLAGAAALLVSAVSFLVGVVALLRAEGPTAPDLNVYLSDPAGQADLLLMVFALTAAVILFLVGFLIVAGTLRESSRLETKIASGLGISAVPLFVGFLALHYALVATLREGIDPSSQGFRILVLQAHAVGDWAGWSGIVLLSGSLLAIGVALIRNGGSIVGWTAVVVAIIGLVLIPTGFGFAFTLLLPVWELIATTYLVQKPGKVVATGASGT